MIAQVCHMHPGDAQRRGQRGLQKIDLDTEACRHGLIGEDQVQPHLVHHHPLLHGHQVLSLAQHQVSRLSKVGSIKS